MVSEEALNPSKNTGERLSLDISSVKVKSKGRVKYWLLVMDEYTKMKWSFFLKKKSDTMAQILPFLHDLCEKEGKWVKYIRCDNADENKALDGACRRDKMGVFFEYTTPGTSQQIGMVERAFVTIYRHMRAMLNRVGFIQAKRKEM